ncbi:NEQ213 [Nanoarchaeum equitans Kin4-M]|uniref:NEQ213 n=1 Tax=Nanoarchaeum equitans (strain Kin4-M) TaxID=228908 RepID=Q74ND2_NANEQ|nr:NEQ213 [Nanoarchaeum equitans Kin4-M]
MECLFCAIASGQIPSYKIYEDNDLVVVLDIYPAHPGQLLIIPKQHVTFIWELDREILHKILEASVIFAKVIGSIYPSVTIYIPNGPYAGQRVPHVAIYIIPRQENDQNKIVMEWAREKLDDNTAKEWVEKIKNYLDPILDQWLAPKQKEAKPEVKEEKEEKPKEDVKDIKQKIEAIKKWFLDLNDTNQ